MKKSKNVVHITTVHHPLDPRIYYKECQSLQKFGYDVILLAPNEANVSKEGNVRIEALKKHKNRFLRMILSTIQAYKKAKKLNADFYHIHDPELLPVAWLLKNKNNIVIYDIHEDYETSILQKEYLAKPISKIIAATYRAIEKVLTKKMELCLAEKYYKEKYPDGKCILNYPIINKKLISNEVAKRSDPNYNLIYTGNVTVDRGALIHSRLPQLDDEVFISFFGRCPEKLANKMYNEAGDNKDNIMIEGINKYIPKEEIEKRYKDNTWLAGVALFPPTEHYMKKELTKFFEYMSVGLPIICSNFPVWENFIKKYSCGITVDPYNETKIKQAIEYLKLNKEEAKKMGDNGRKAVIKELNWSEEEKKLIEWYEELETNMSGGKNE